MRAFPCSRVRVQRIAAGLLLAACSGSPLNPNGAPVLDSEGGREPCGQACSPDLKSIVSACDGTLVRACENGLGCANGECIRACDAVDVSKGSYGCSFYTLPPETIETEGGPGSCFALNISNTWDLPAHLTMEFSGAPLDISGSVYRASRASPVATVMYDVLPNATVPPGEVATLFLAEERKDRNTHCPEGVTPALRKDPLTHGSGLTRTFRLVTDVPVTANSVFPYSGAPSYLATANLLLPTSAWDREHYAIESWEKISKGGSNNVPFFQVVALQDDTVVRMVPNATMSDGRDYVGVAAGQTFTYRLGRGQALQIAQGEELTGSPIVADKPITVFGGTTCMYIPAEAPACDAAQQQFAPVRQWGAEYAMVPHRPRSGAPELTPFRIVGGVDGTRLTFDPVAPMGAPADLMAGQLVQTYSSTPFSVRSQDADHPFYAAAYMTGASAVTEGFQDGDPEFVNVVPTAQYLQRYLFYVDVTFPNTWIDLVRTRDAKGFFRDVTVDCAGVVSGWKPVGGSGALEFASVALTASSQPVAYGTTTCGTGRREATSDGPFSVTVWGTGTYASFAYPGGTGSRPITSAVPVLR